MEWATIDSELHDGAFDTPGSSALRRALTARRDALHSALWRLEQHAGTLEQIAAALERTLRAGHKLLVIGNGGSAAEAQHFAGELVGRFLRDRQPYAALALTSDSSVLTAIGNDYGFEDVFKRQVEALCVPGDIVFAISTSGDSANVLAGVDAARRNGASTVGLTGGGGGRLLEACDECIRFPSDDTPRIQEGHTLIGHILCEIVEDELAGG
jgi:D-sedoheptulose 7-phosphate isomerase